MNVIAAFTDNSIMKVLEPTKDAFMELLNKRRAEIEGFPQRTFRYGSTDRHQLDVYYPDPKAISDGTIPVLFFEYGGGFITGDRKQEPPHDLGYSNLGVFFANRGILTVIADYRLAPTFKFPQPVEDVRDALAWFITNSLTVLNASPAGPLDQSKVGLENIFVMGHSAGANLVTTLYLSPSLLPLTSPIRAATRGLIPQGGAYQFSFANSDMLTSILLSYYGSQEATLENMPLTLLQEADAELVKYLPEVFALRSEREPQMLRDGNDLFVETLKERVGRAIKYEIMEGHNHISPHWALLSGEGQDWGEAVVEWIKAMVGRERVH